MLEINSTTINLAIMVVGILCLLCCATILIVIGIAELFGDWALEHRPVRRH